RDSLAVQVGEQQRSSRYQLTLRLENPLRGDPEIVVRGENLLNESAEDIVLKQVEPLLVGQRDFRGVGIAAALLVRHLRGRTLVIRTDHAPGEHRSGAQDDEFATHQSCPPSNAG